MTVLAADGWTVLTAVATIGLLLAAIVAAIYAKRDIDTQRDALNAAEKDSEEARGLMERQIEAHTRSATDAITAARADAERAQDLARKDTDTHLKSSAEALRATYRPLLIDVNEHRKIDSDLDPTNNPHLDFFDEAGTLLYTISDADWRRVHVAVSDNRLHVAVPLRNVGTGPALVDIASVRLEGYGDPVGRSVHRERVPPGETTRVLCTHGVSAPTSENLSELRVHLEYRDLTDGRPTDAGVLLGADGNGWHVRGIELDRT